MFVPDYRGALALMAVLAALPPTPAGARGGGGSEAGTPQPYIGYDLRREFQAGLKALDAGRYHDAKQRFERVLAVFPNQPEVLVKLGQTDAGLGLWRSAAHAYQISLQLDPRQIAPVRELALTEIRLGRRDSAITQLSVLKQRAEACGVTCPDATELAAAVREVEAAMSGTAAAAAAPVRTSAS